MAITFCCNRRRVTGALALGVSLWASGAIAADDAFPSKPIRIIVPFTTGGVADTSARLVADHLGRRLNQQIVIDNKPGASGNIGMAMVKAAPPDGYTWVLGFDGTMVINPHVFAKVGFDSITDYAPIGKIGDATLILVAHPGIAAKNLQELIALSKKNTGRFVLRHFRHGQHAAHRR